LNESKAVGKDFKFSGDSIAPPQCPGLGVTLDVAKIAKYQFEIRKAA
jgi:L-alanine-DL-glutamate epimerase-like enolase superfamily enzyme